MGDGEHNESQNLHPKGMQEAAREYDIESTAKGSIGIDLPDAGLPETAIFSTLKLGVDPIENTNQQTIHKQNPSAYRPVNTSDIFIDPSIEYFKDYGIGLSTLQDISAIASATGRTAAEELIRAGILSPSRFGAISAERYGINFDPQGPDPTHLTGDSLRLSEVENGFQLAKPDGYFNDIVTVYKRLAQAARNLYCLCACSH